MLYTLSLHVNEVFISSAFLAATVFTLISLIKEKKDERKRA